MAENPDRRQIHNLPHTENTGEKLKYIIKFVDSTEMPIVLIVIAERVAELAKKIAEYRASFPKETAYIVSIEEL